MNKNLAGNQVQTMQEPKQNVNEITSHTKSTYRELFP